MELQIRMTVGEARELGILDDICEITNRQDLSNYWEDHEFTLSWGECAMIGYNTIREWLER